MKSKYLNEIDCEMPEIKENDSRREQFKKELEEYGIASYDTWNIDIAFAQFLYVIFRMYNELNIVDTNLVQICINGEQWHMQDAVDYIIEESKKYLIQCREDLNIAEFPKNFFDVLKNLLPYAWW